MEKQQGSDRPGEVKPANEVNPTATPETAGQASGSWLASNMAYLVLIGSLFGYLAYKFTLSEIMAIVVAALGLGLVIFIHELGHFLVAKWCDVHVETFSIGFGPPLPGCSFRWGETTYMIALFPLGGYVKMVGEGVENDDNDSDPRSFKNKPVWQRMAIISAGVTMNLLLAFACFVFVFQTHGDEQTPGIIGGVDNGSPAWIVGARSGDVIQWIDNKGPYPSFDEDLLPTVMNSQEDKPLRFVFGPPGGHEWITTTVQPRRSEEDLRPVIGISHPRQLQLWPSKYAKSMEMPTVFSSAAASAEPPFDFGDTIIGTTDPDHVNQIKELPADPRNPDHRDFFEFQNRLHLLAGKEMVIEVIRDRTKEKVNIKVPPAFHYTLGMQMRMGKVAAVRNQSPGAVAGVHEDDIIDEVLVTDGRNAKTRFANIRGKETPGREVAQHELDPERLPHELRSLAQDQGGIKEIQLTVLRPNPPPNQSSPNSHKELQRVPLKLSWDQGWKFNHEAPFNLTSPLSIPELGIAYWVDATVEAIQPASPASQARVEKSTEIRLKKGDVIKDGQGNLVPVTEGETIKLEEGFKVNLREGDQIKACRFSYHEKGNNSPQIGKWKELQSGQWAYVFDSLQTVASIKTVGLRLDRDQLEVSIEAKLDQNWPLADRGLLFVDDTRLKKSANLGQALSMGVNKTFNFIDQIFGNLKSMAKGRVSPKVFGGPIMIAQAAYFLVSDNIYKFIVFLGIIGVNLAVINFLPIPVLDGGHMVFLVYEKLRGKPVPDPVRIAATYAGLALIVCLMIVVFYIDLKRF